MVNGNYIIYGNRPFSDSEIVSDHVHSRTAERRPRRKLPRASEPRPHPALHNETDAAKSEKRVNEPRLLRYVPTSDVEEHFVIDKFETYDLKPTEATPRRYAFKKKPRNPADGSVNYAYSRSSSSCSSPGGTLPPIAEHEPSSRARGPPAPRVYDTKLDKYFTKPKEVKKFSAKGSHPDSLYRVAAGGGAGAGRAARALRLVRWPLALLVVCLSLAVFVYFLMPDNFQPLDTTNATYWESNVADADTHRAVDRSAFKTTSIDRGYTQDPRTPEIDFHDADNGNTESTVSGTVTDKIPQKKLPAPPVFPTHLTPEVQYGNEDADTGKARSPKNHQVNFSPVDSILKLHITQKPEKPLAIYFKDGEGITTTTTTTTTEPITGETTVNDFANYEGKKTYIAQKLEKPLDSYFKHSEGTTTTTTTTEAITRAMSVNNYANYGDKQPTDKYSGLSYKPYANLSPWAGKENNIYVAEPVSSPEIQEYYKRITKTNLNHTSGHSKLFGISIEDAEKMQSTTQSSVYNTRVSPTLPTWRDGDDTTTKKYPVNVNPDVSQCRSTSLSLCRGVLPYDLASKPAVFNGVSISTLLPEIEYIVAINCSARMKNFMCALLEPECSPPPQAPKMPCYNLCKAILDGCESVLPHALSPAFNCRQYSSANCVGARAPCSPREMACGDGSCIPSEWICDGTRDCPAGEDEAPCSACGRNEFRCQSGACIGKRWLCDGYADCPDGDDETECGGGEPGDQAAGSAPAPAVQPAARQRTHNTRDNDSSKELLITSDTGNALKRNFPRRPSLSRLTPYYPPMLQEHHKNKNQEIQEKAPVNKNDKHESAEDVNADDLGLFGETVAQNAEKERKAKNLTTAPPNPGRAPLPKSARRTSNDEDPDRAKLERTINKLERIIDGAALLKKAVQAPVEEYQDQESVESTTVVEKEETTTAPPTSTVAWVSAHTSPCPSVSQCRPTSLSLCRGVLPYDLAGKPAVFNGISISKFHRQIEYVLATKCSARIKNFVCALLEPECSPPPQAPKMPCYNFCKAVLEGCETYLPHILAPAFNCRQYSSSNCVGARAPCSPREMACGDGSCIPREWICDGTRDCPAGEDEAPCSACGRNEFRCQSGPCISRRWLGDGYADCPDGDDEAPPGARAAGTGPAHALRADKIATHQRNYNKYSESMPPMTSDSSNALKRNFTRRPAASRLSFDSPPKLQEHHKTKKQKIYAKSPRKKNDQHESIGKRKKAQSNPGTTLLPKSGRRTSKTHKKLDLIQLIVKKAMQLPEEEYQVHMVDNNIIENEETSTHNIDT